MSFVLDTSALAKLVLEEPGHRELRAWYRTAADGGETIEVPSLAYYEVGRVIQREFPDLEPAERLFLHERVLQRVAFFEPDPGRLFAVAHDSIALYDASFLALAEERHATLVSADRRMLDLAKDRGVPTLAF